MSDAGSVTQWIDRAKRGDGDAVERLWKRYYQRLVGLASEKLPRAACRQSDEEDLAVSALCSFFRGAAQGQFQRLADRDDLWRLLFGIVRHKAIDLWRRANRRTASGGREVGESFLATPLAEEEGNALEYLLAAKDADPQLAAEVTGELAGLLGKLRDGPLRQIAVWKMEGLTNGEIAHRLGRVERTVERKLTLIRKLLGPPPPGF